MVMKGYEEKGQEMQSDGIMCVRVTVSFCVCFFLQTKRDTVTLSTLASLACLCSIDYIVQLFDFYNSYQCVAMGHGFQEDFEWVFLRMYLINVTFDCHFNTIHCDPTNKPIFQKKKIAPPLMTSITHIKCVTMRQQSTQIFVLKA